MTRTPLALLLVIGLAVAVPVGLSAPVESQMGGDGPTKIDDCRVIDEPGTYALTGDITNGGGDNFTYASQTCLVVRSDDVVLDGRGHRVDGLGVTDTTGIAVVGEENDTVENVTIRNATVTDWNRGIYVRNGDGTTVREVTTSYNAYGMSIERSNRTALIDSEASENLVGVYEGPDTGDTGLSRTSFEGNYAGDVVSDTEAPDTERSARSGDDR